MTNLSELSATKLQALYDQRFEADSTVGKACIAAGLGNWRPSDRDEALQGKRNATAEELSLCQQWRDASEAFFAVVDEMEKRKRWHGSLKPIRKAS